MRKYTFLASDNNQDCRAFKITDTVKKKSIHLMKCNNNLLVRKNKKTKCWEYSILV